MYRYAYEGLFCCIFDVYNKFVDIFPLANKFDKYVFINLKKKRLKMEQFRVHATTMNHKMEQW